MSIAMLHGVGGGKKPSGTITITENGTHNVAQYASANVNVPQTLFKQVVDKSITEIKAEDLAGLTTIGDYAFCYCGSLLKIELPNSITNIGAYAFRNCATDEIIIPSSVVDIGSEAFASFGYRNTKIDYRGTLAQWFNINFAHMRSVPFYSNDGILYINNNRVINTVVEVPDTVTQIKDYALINWRASRIIVPSSVNSIGLGALRFNDCDFIVIKNTTPPTLANAGAFDNTSDCPIYVFTPNDYKIATNWTSLASRIYPLVSTVADLQNIDTTTYTKACVEGNEEYTEYTYDGSQWNPV